MAELYRTLIVNRTNKVLSLKNPSDYIRNYSYIQPGQSLIQKFSDSSYFLVPFERVAYRKNGKVDLRPRKKFEPKQHPFPVTTFLNAGGKLEEVLLIADNDSLRLPRGIPITRNVPITSFYAEFSEVTIEKPIPTPVPSTARPGLIEIEYRPNIQYKKRSPAELDRIKKERERIYLKSAGLG